MKKQSTLKLHFGDIEYIYISIVIIVKKINVAHVFTCLEVLETKRMYEETGTSADFSRER